MLWPTCRLREAVLDISMLAGRSPATHRGCGWRRLGMSRSDPRSAPARGRLDRAAVHPRSPDLEGTALPVAGNE